MEDKVVHAFPGHELPENPLQIEPRNPNLPYYCSHDSVRINEHERTISCARCAATLDAFDFVKDNARTIQRAYEAHRHATRLVGDLNGRVNDLKKEEGRLKSRMKRLNEKSGDKVLSVRAQP